MSDLREKLTDRLSELLHPYLGYEGVWPGGVEALADECIRQMEWAFQRGQARGIQDERGTVAHGSMRKTALTAAPDDWRPA